MILPMCVLDSISACAAAASASGNTRWMTGFSSPRANSGHTRSRNACAISTFRAWGLARSVEPVTVSRLTMIGRQSISARPPCRNPMNTSRPSSARHLRFFAM